MQKMPHDELKGAIDAIRTRLQAELEQQLSSFQTSQGEALDAARRQAETEAEQRWSAKVEAEREEWAGRVKSELASASADAERRFAGETEKIRAEAAEAASDAAARVRDEMSKALAAESERARAEIDAERTRAQGAIEAERARSQSEIDAARIEAQGLVDGERTRAHGEIEAERQRIHGEMAAERERLQAEIEAERERTRTELSGERDRTGAELEAERLKARTLSTALDEAKAALARERAAARSATEALEAQQTRAAITEAHVSERQSQLLCVERLLEAVRTIGGARSLSDALNGLLSAVAAEAPRAALFVVNGKELQGWRASGFGSATTPPNTPAHDAGVLGEAATTGSAVSTTAAKAPAFAKLPADRVGIAVPITVGGHTVAVLYADDGSEKEPQVPASWPEAIQIICGHASACLAHITALRTAQAMRVTTGAAISARGSGSDEDSSARRYARLLVSEIKLYNEAAVRVGREKRDLLERLRPEIERARRLYEERVSPSVGARSAYFQQELVHTLADGDSGLLGSAGVSC